jgi:hypothetical protein
MKQPMKQHTPMASAGYSGEQRDACGPRHADAVSMTLGPLFGAEPCA